MRRNPFYIIRNSSYRKRYIALIRLTNFVDGLIAVLSFGFVGTCFEMDAHRLATKDAFNIRKKEKERMEGKAQ